MVTTDIYAFVKKLTRYTCIRTYIRNYILYTNICLLKKIYNIYEKGVKRG